MRIIVSAAVLLLGATVTASAGAQSLDCGRPKPTDGECVLLVKGPEVRDSIRVQVTNRAGVIQRGVEVSFSGPPGSVVTPVRTDADGQAATVWVGRVTAPVTVVANARVDGAIVTRSIILKPAPVKTTYTLRPLNFPDLSSNPDHEPDYWYADRQIGHPYGVIVDGVGQNPDTCARVLVLFHQTSSGAVTPDSVYARYVEKDRFSDATFLDRLFNRNASDKRMECIAVTRWKLGKEVGEHHLRAGLPGDPAGAVQFRARARALPRLIAGLALTKVGGFDRMRAVDSTFKVTRTTPTGEVVFDSVKKSVSFDTFAPQWMFTPAVGVDWPIKASWPYVRASVSASITNARTDWFAGVSLLQLWQGYVQEGVGVDLQGILHVSKRSVVVNGATCATTVATCVSETQTGVVGAGVMLTVDTALLGVITSAFGITK